MLKFSELCDAGVKVAKLYPVSPLSPEKGPQPFLPSVLTHASDQLIGRPGRALDEIVSGHALAPGSYVRQSMFPVGPRDPEAGAVANAARYLAPTFLYLPAAMTAVSALNAPEHERAALVGEAVGSALGTAAGAPVGYIGNMIGGMTGASIGRTLGSAFGG
jgi:hypothetical protein